MELWVKGSLNQYTENLNSTEKLIVTMQWYNTLDLNSKHKNLINKHQIKNNYIKIMFNKLTCSKRTAVRNENPWQ